MQPAIMPREQGERTEMRGYQTEFNLFAEKELGEYLDANKGALRAYVGQQTDGYILNVNEAEYLEHVVSKFSIDNLTIDFSNASVDQYEKDIPADPKPIIVYHLPFSGDPELLRCCPSTRIAYWTARAYIDGSSVCFEVLSLREDAAEIKREAERIMGNMRIQAEYVRTQVDGHNNQLPNSAKQCVSVRMRKIRGRHDMLGALGLPTKKQKNQPSTYAVPTPDIRDPIVPRPSSQTQSPKLDPTLDESTYEQILNLINDTGKTMERLPSTYIDKDEEALRDHFLLTLQPGVQASATGETFNKRGKTDILLRCDNTNIFVGECKFWHGKKAYLDTIEQLFSYLTWRDSKSAIILFVRNKDFTNVLRNIERITPEFPHFEQLINKKSETWFNYILHFPGDQQRKVYLAVLAFHLP
jgi:hypothetical protein